MTDFHFLRPWWLITIPLLIVLFIYLWRTMHRQGNWQAICEPQLLSQLLVKNPGKRFPWGFIYLVIASLLVLIALSGPTWSHWPVPVFRHSNARVIVLDVSNSMNAVDIAPSRLTRAKYKVLDLLHRIHEGQTGMLVFSKMPFIVSPLTQDSQTIAAMVPVLNTGIVPIQGSDISAALKKAGELFVQAGATRGSIILITDSAPSLNAFKTAKALQAKGYHTFVLGVGTVKGAPTPLAKGGFAENEKGNIIFNKLPVTALEKLAAAGHGYYIGFQENNYDTNKLLAWTDENTLHAELKQTLQKKILWKDEGHWFIWAAMLFALFAFRRGWWEQLIT